MPLTASGLMNAELEKYLAGRSSEEARAAILDHEEVADWGQLSERFGRHIERR